MVLSWTNHSQRIERIRDENRENFRCSEDRESDFGYTESRYTFSDATYDWFRTVFNYRASSSMDILSSLDFPRYRSEGFEFLLLGINRMMYHQQNLSDLMVESSLKPWRATSDKRDTEPSNADLPTARIAASYLQDSFHERGNQRNDTTLLTDLGLGNLELEKTLLYHSLYPKMELLDALYVEYLVTFMGALEDATSCLYDNLH